MIVWRERKNNSPLPHFPWCGRNSSQDRVAYPKLTVARKNALMAKYCQALMHFTCVETMSLMASMWLSRPWVVVSKMIWILWKRLKEAWRKRREESIRMAVAGGSGRPRNLHPMTLGTKKFKQSIQKVDIFYFCRGKQPRFSCEEIGIAHHGNIPCSTQTAACQARGFHENICFQLP